MRVGYCVDLGLEPNDFFLKDFYFAVFLNQLVLEHFFTTFAIVAFLIFFLRRFLSFGFSFFQFILYFLHLDLLVFDLLE